MPSRGKELGFLFILTEKVLNIYGEVSLFRDTVEVGMVRKAMGIF